ncbi:MAG: MltA domain-containing protein, partial [Bdellovibrionales bacterium]
MLTAIAINLLIATSWAQDSDFLKTNYTTPTKKLSVAEFPMFSDDLGLQGFELAANRQLDRFQNKDLTGTIALGGVNYPLTKARSSLEVFLQLTGAFKACKKTTPAAQCLAALNDQVRQRFNVFAPDLKAGDPRYGQPENSLFTGYATQPIPAKSKPDDVFSHAIYALPHAKDAAKTRGEIDFHGALAGKKLELGYAPNLFDLYLLHIEGGGYVTMKENGTTVNYFLSYDGTNNQHFTWISKYMMSKGYITNPSSGAQRKYLRLHPEKQEEIYTACPSYVFFKVSTQPPQGAEGIPVSPGRSVATDNKLYAFKGLLTYIESRRPQDLGSYDLEQEDPSLIPLQPFSRFFIDQDTGGAITGKGRADIYFGLENYAQYAATYQQQTGNIYFLLLK